VLFQSAEALIEDRPLDGRLALEDSRYRLQAIARLRFVEMLEELKMNNLLVRELETVLEEFIRGACDRAAPLALHETSE
jgi:hypothetical protein